MFAADQRDLVLGGRLGQEVIDPGLVGDGLSGQRVVAGDHHGADAHLPHRVEPLPHALLDHVLEVDHPEGARGPVVLAVGDDQRGAAIGADALHARIDVLGRLAAVFADPGQHGGCGTLADPPGAAVGVQVDAAHPGLRAERDEVRLRGHPVRAGSQFVGVLGEHDDRAAFGGLVGQTRQLRGIGDLTRGGAVAGQELGGHAVAEGDRARLVQQQGVHIPGGLDGATAHRQDVALHQPVHAGDADRRQQRPDRRRDQADQQRHEHHAGHTRAGQREAVGDARLDRLAVDRKWLQGGHGEQEDQRQRGEQDVQRDFVGGLLPVGALHQGDHPVHEALAGQLRDLHDDPVRKHLGPPGHRGAVAAGLADHRCGLAGDHRLVHARDALKHIAVAGDDVAGFDDHAVAASQRRGRHDFPPLARVSRLPPDQAACLGLAFGAAQRRGLSLAAAFGHRLGQVGQQHGQPQPDDDQPREPRRRDHREHRRPPGADLDGQHDRVVPQGERVQLAKRVRQRPHEQVRIEQARLDPACLRDGRGRDTGSSGDHHPTPSAIGARASIGRKVSATRMIVTPASIPANCGR